MRAALAGALAIAALAVTGIASAGGWATAGLEPPSGGLGAGETWNADVKILQHGVTPLVGATPHVEIRNATSGKTVKFPARPTDKTGIYRAEVVFPSGGEWTYHVYDGFTQYPGAKTSDPRLAKTHDFGTLTIAAGSSSGFDFPSVPVTGGILLALAAAAALVLIARRNRFRTAPASH